MDVCAKTTLEPHDCSKMVRKELSPIIEIGASRELVVLIDVLILLKEHAELVRPLKAVNSRAALSASFEK